jgi:hypothetical protein
VTTTPTAKMTDAICSSSNAKHAQKNMQVAVQMNVKIFWSFPSKNKKKSAKESIKEDRFLRKGERKNST